MRVRLVALASAACALLLLAVSLPSADAATLRYQWTGRYGTLGTITVRQFTSGTGALVVNLKALSGARYTVAAYRSGCAGTPAYRVTLPTASHAIARTLTLTAAQVRALGAKPAVKFGSTCRMLARTYPPAATPTPSPTETPAATPTPAPTACVLYTVRLGTVITGGNLGGTEMTIVSAEQWPGSQVTGPGPGRAAVTVLVSMSATGSVQYPATVTVPVMTVSDASGGSYARAAYQRWPELPTSYTDSGFGTSGWVTFDVPASQACNLTLLVQNGPVPVAVPLR